jgi:hypothetical protein
LGTAEGGSLRCEEIPSILNVDSRRGCEQVADKFPDCTCEEHSVQPTLSPGPVIGTETLVRFVPAHDYDNEKKLIKPSLFSHAGTNGMSVTRIEKTDRPSLVQQESKGNYIGYVTAVCGAVRVLRWEACQVFAVYDTALPENRAHADVCQAIFRPRSKGSEMRRMLQRTFGSAVRRFAVATDIDGTVAGPIGPALPNPE